MAKTTYYLRFILFIIYLICMFFLIDKVLTISTLSNMHFVLCIIYSILIILSILSKKKVFIDNISYNVLNIGLYIYTFVMSFMAFSSSKLDILNNGDYYKNNFILLIFMLIVNIIYTLYLNKEEKVKY